MLLSSLISILALFINKKEYMIILLCISLGLNFILKTDLNKKVKSLKYILYILIFSLSTQIIFINEGKVIYSIWDIHITDQGLNSSILTFLRVLTIVLSSWLIRETKFVNKYFKEYLLIFNIVLKISPEIFLIIKKRMKIKDAFRYVLKKVYKELNLI